MKLKVWVVLIFLLLSISIFIDWSRETIQEQTILVKTYTSHVQSPIRYNVLKDVNSSLEVNIRGSFKLDKLKNYENIFQTSDINQGFRIEIDELGSITLVFPTKTGLQGIPMGQNIQENVWHAFALSFNNEKILSISMDNKQLYNQSRPDIVSVVDNIVIGGGFDSTRPFLGEIKDFKLEYKTYKEWKFAHFYIGLIQFLLVISIILLLTNNFMRSPQGNSYIQKMFSDRTVFLTFLGIGTLALIGINALYCNLLGALGYTGFAYTNFLFPPEDRFADLIKIALSFTKPLAGVIDTAKINTWPEIFQNYFYHNPYGGVEALQHGQFSHLAGTPLGKLYGMMNGYIAFTLSPTLLYGLYLTLYACAIGFMIHMLKNKNKREWIFIVLTILSYPGLIILFRGHFFSAFAVMILATALIALIKDKQRLSWIAFGIAMNMRPNFVFFAPLIYSAFRSPKPFLLYCLKLAIWSIALFLTLYWAVHTLYPDYTFARSVEATRIYNTLYNYGNLGLAFGSSFYGALYAAAKLYGIDPHRVSIVGHLIAGVSIVSVGIGILLRIFSATEIIFLLAALYSLFTPVLGDYQLILFILPIIVFLVAKDEYRDDSPKHIFIIALASMLLLSPKNYVYIESLGAYSQVFMNPAILMAALSYLLWQRSTLINGRVKHAVP